MTIRRRTTTGCTAPLIRVVATGSVALSVKTMIVYGNERNKELHKENSREQKLKNEATLMKKIKSGEWQLIPCGKCIDCRMAYARSWANRIELELPYHKNNYFVTLTYNPENVPIGTNGETTNLTLQKKDLQAFNKRLREYLRRHDKPGWDKMLYYGAGEYGEKSHRPHYHEIVFDCALDQNRMEVYKRERGYTYYKTKELEKIWPYGWVVIGEANWQSAAYVARYVTKKLKGPTAKKTYENLGIEPEFSIMSTKTPIGSNYLKDHWQEIYPADQIQMKNGRIEKPARYFDKVMDQTHMAEELADEISQRMDIITEELENDESTSDKMQSAYMRKIKEHRREQAQAALETARRYDQKTLEEYYDTKSLKNQRAIKSLPRPDC